MAKMLETSGTTYSPAQRAVSLGIGMAFGLPLTSAAAFASGPVMLNHSPVASSNGWAAHSASTATAHASGFSPAAMTQTGFGAQSLVHTSASSAAGIVHARQANLTPNFYTTGNINLQSAKLSFLAGNLANFQNLTIDVGGHSKVVDLNTKLTGAELVAAQQVLSGAGQTIKLAANGTATGGQVLLNGSFLSALDNSVGGSVSSLTIAKGVQVVDTLSSLSFSGNLFNYGSLLTASGAAGATDAISARNVFNGGSATIGSYTGGSGLYGADVSLTGTQSVINNGVISSANNLTISSPVIMNVAVSGSPAQINAGGNVNLNTASLTNSGTIASTNGNVNLASTTGLDLYGAGGTIQANNGNVNFNTANADINVYNGNLVSQQVNFAAGTGNVNATMDNVTGTVNASGYDVHINAATEDLKMGTLDAINDPLVVNSTGSVDLGTVTSVSGQPVTVIAAQNIYSTAATAINTSSATGNGGQVNLIAGATVTGGGGANAVVTKASATGGLIDLTGGNIDGSGSTVALSAINTSSTNNALGTSNGGNVQLIAYAGKNTGSGSVFAGTTTINTSSKNATAGNVTVIAGAKTGNAITLGSITATGAGVAPGGVVTVDASTPVITVTTKGTTGVVFDPTGAQITNVFAATKTPNAASVSVGNVNASGGINISTGANATIANTTSDLNLGTIAVGKTGVLNASDSAGNINVTGVITGGTANLSSSGTTTSSGAGSVNTTNLNLNAVGGTGAVVGLTTNVTNLVLGVSGQTTIDQGTAALNVSGIVNGSNLLFVNSNGQINVNQPLFDNGGGVEFTTATTAKGGIAINAPIFVGNAGQVTLQNLGTGTITEAKGVTLAGGTINIISVNTGLGSASSPFVTNASKNLDVNVVSTKAKTYVSDQNTGTLNFNGLSAFATGGGSLFLTSQASELDLTSANYNNVSVTDATFGASHNGVVIGGSFAIGDGLGTVTINSAAGISQTKNTFAVSGTAVTLTATASGASIGTGTKTPIYVSTPSLTATSTQGSVFVSDNQAVTVQGGSGLAGIFSVVDTGAPNAKTGNSLTVGKPITGGFITLQTTNVAGNILVTGAVGTSATNLVSLDSAAGVTTKGTVLGANISFTSATGGVAVGGKVGDAASNLAFTSNSAAGMTITSPLSGHSIALTAANGPLTIKAAVTGTGANSVVDLEGTSATATGNAVVVGAAVTGSNISIGYADPTTGQGNIAVNSAVGNASTVNVDITANSGKTANGGSITGTGLITGSNVDLSAANNIGTATAPVKTAAGTLSVNQTSTAAGTGAFITQNGNLSLGTSADNNLVVKVTGSLDVGGTVTAPNYNLGASGNVVIDGVLQNTTGPNPTTGTQVITAGGNFIVSTSGLLSSTKNSTPITVTATGVGTIDGTVSAQTFNLNSKGGFNLTSTGLLNDYNDNIVTTGPVTLAGQVGTVDRPDNFALTTTGAFTLAPGITFIGGANVTAATITNYTDLDGNGNVSLTATGSGNALINYGNITGINITLKTTNAGGAIYNAPGATIIASQKALQTGAPTINLDTYKVNNLGEISAIGLVSTQQGSLNFTSPGALTITGNTGSFDMNYFSAVNLKAGGNIVVGGVVNGATVNPFSNFDAAHELGTFTVNTTGTFTSPMKGVSVVTNTTGSFGGTIAITASNVLYNGVGTNPVFALSATGAGPTLSNGKAPVSLTLTGSQGISIGGASGKFTVDVEGYGNTSLSTFSTPGALLIDTTGFNVNYTSLALTGGSRVLVTGNLNEGSLPSTTLSITTNSTAPFLIGGATTNGVAGVTLGQGISAGQVTIVTGGSVVVGTKTVGAVLNGTTSVSLTTNTLTVNNGSDISGLALNVSMPVTASTGDLTYNNYNLGTIGEVGGVSASAINLTNPVGNVILSSGTSNTTIAVGTNPNGPAISGVQLAGGSININAQGLKFTGNLQLNATGGIDGGSVIINLSGLTGATSNPTVTVGKASGQIQANVADTDGAFEPNGAGTFRLSNMGNIVVNGLNALSDSDSSIQLGSHGGNLSFIANSNGLSTTGSTVLVDGTNLSGLSVNLFQIASNSTIPLTLQKAGAGTNGITGSNNVTLFGGNLSFSNNTGTLVSNGVDLEGVNLNLSSDIGMDLSKNNGFFVSREYITPTQTAGGVLTFTAPYITVGANGLALQVQGGAGSGGSISVTTTTTPYVIGLTKLNGGTLANAISFDVGDMQQAKSNPNYVAGTVNISMPGNVVVNGNGIIFQDSFIGTAGIGGNLNLTSNTGGNVVLDGASSLVGLNFSTITFNLTGTTGFNLGQTATTGNGINNLTQLTAGAIVVNNTLGNVNTANANLLTNSMTLNGASVTFGSNQVINLEPDDDTVGFTGPLNPAGLPTGNGGTFVVNTPVLNFGTTGGVTINAPGAGAASDRVSSVGGTITINYTGTKTLAINSSTFAGLNVSNAIGTKLADPAAPPGNLQTAGVITFNSSNANVVVTAASTVVPTAKGTVFTYGYTGGTLNITGPNVAITGIEALSQASQNNSTNQVAPGLGLAAINITTNSATPFTVGGATGTVVNGITDVSPLLTATALSITNSFTPATGKTGGGIDMTNGQGITVNNLTLTTPSVVTFASGGTYTAVASVNTNADPTGGGVGGKITVNAGSVALSNLSINPTTFKATGTSDTGAGGTIAFNVTGTNLLAIGTGGGELAFDVSNSSKAAGATSGAVNITNGGDISADLGGFTFGPSQPTGSGSLSLTGGNLLISNSSALNKYNLQSITLSSTSKSDFVFGNATVNGFADTTATSLQAVGVTINANASGSLTGGIVASGPTTIKASSLTLSTLNTITLDSTVGLAVTQTSSGGGGSMTLTAGGYAVIGGGSAQLDASSTAGNGGTITVSQTGLGTLNLNNTDGISFKVTGLATAGTVSVTSADNLNVNGDAFTFGPSAPDNTGSGRLTLSGANVLITNTAPLNVHPLSSLTITTLSNTDFSFSNALLNGFADPTSSLTVATFALNNNASGSLYGGIDAKGLTNGDFTLKATNIALTTQNTITFAYSGTALKAEPSSATQAGGSIAINAGAIKFATFSGNTVTLNAAGGPGGTGGSVTIVDVGTAGDVIGAGGFNVNVAAAAGKAGGALTLTSGGAITADGTAMNFGGAFPAGSGNTLVLNADGILAFANAANAILPNMAKLTLSSDSAQSFYLGGAASGTNGITDAGLKIYADSMTIANQGGSIILGTANGLNSSTGMTLNAARDIGTALQPIVLNDGAENKNVSINAGGNVYVHITDKAATSIGASTIIGNLVIDTDATAGSVNLGYTGGAVAAVSAKDVSFTYNNNAAATNVIVGSVGAFDGNITVSSAAEEIFVPLQAVITAYNGNIVLNNTNTLGAANITFQDGFSTPVPDAAPVITPGATLTAHGPAPLLTQGNVTIAMGALGYTPVAGTAPTAQINVSGPHGAVDFGEQISNPNGSITTTDDTVKLQGLNRVLSFNTGTFGDNAIKVGAYVTITADPPGSYVYTSSGQMAASANAASGAADAVAQAGTFTARTLTAPSTSSLNTLTMPAVSSASSTSSSSGIIGANLTTVSAPLSTINNVSVNALTAGAANGLVGGNDNGTGGISSGSASGVTSRGNGFAGNGRVLSGEVSNAAQRKLFRGPLLLSPLQNETVETPYGSVTVAANSMALIISSDQGLAVYNLHDTHRGAVVVNLDGASVAIAPGRTAVFAPSGKSLEEVNPARFVGYRRVTGKDVSTGKVYQADFEILSVLRGLKDVKDMLHAEDSKTRSIMTGMLKTAAILNSLSGTSQEPYALYLTPEVTAYAASAQH